MLSQLETYLRMERLPHIWCPGCGNGIVLGSLVRAIHELGLDQDKTVIVSGIGCSSRASGYLDFNTLHTTHGRALAFATGVKLARPELNVFVLTGDGDATAIGGNHFIHAARRNIDLTVVVFNNNIYGMTGGQYSPLTPAGRRATTAPFGTIERNFDIAQLAQAAGATYVARSTTYHSAMLTNLMVAGVRNKGLSVIEAVTACPVQYGRRNKLGGGAEMILWQKEHAVTVKQAEKMSPEELDGKIVIGELHRSEAPEYTAMYEQLIQKAQEK
ncbi:2-oxoglutarate ferredoxin oxidoreductase subunit beta [Clostridiales bacterium PH28_bin88]|nr:2-oxoglutarate ferredoxin oxidoreductase subunit beta [Clostridiales bacterium PH28_bin88]